VFADRTGLSEDNLAELWKALGNLFDPDSSAARGMTAARGLYIFKHFKTRIGTRAPVV
jgi:CRISPR-associated protein Csd2